jgi:hypothetical protein
MRLNRATRKLILFTLTDPTFTEQQRSRLASRLALRPEVRKMQQRAAFAFPPHFILGIVAASAYADSARSVLYRTAVAMRALPSSTQNIIVQQER